MDIIRTAYYIRGLELMKLIFAVLDVSLKRWALHVVIKQKVFYIYFIKNRLTEKSSDLRLVLFRGEQASRP